MEEFKETKSSYTEILKALKAYVRQMYSKNYTSNIFF